MQRNPQIEAESRNLRSSAFFGEFFLSRIHAVRNV
jgi:hypothetical protein